MARLRPDASQKIFPGDMGDMDDSADLCYNAYRFRGGPHAPLQEASLSLMASMRPALWDVLRQCRGRFLFSVRSFPGGRDSFRRGLPACPARESPGGAGLCAKGIQPWRDGSPHLPGHAQEPVRAAGLSSRRCPSILFRLRGICPRGRFPRGVPRGRKQYRHHLLYPPTGWKESMIFPHW